MCGDHGVKTMLYVLSGYNVVIKNRTNHNLRTVRKLHNCRPQLVMEHHCLKAVQGGT